MAHAHVGYISDGAFFRLFSPDVGPDHPVNADLGIPESFELFQHDYVSSSDVFMQNLDDAMDRYILQHYRTWYRFANERHNLGLRSGEILLIVQQPNGAEDRVIGLRQRLMDNYWSGSGHRSRIQPVRLGDETIQMCADILEVLEYVLEYSSAFACMAGRPVVERLSPDVDSRALSFYDELRRIKPAVTVGPGGIAAISDYGTLSPTPSTSSGGMPGPRLTIYSLHHRLQSRLLPSSSSSNKPPVTISEERLGAHVTDAILNVKRGNAIMSLWVVVFQKCVLCFKPAMPVAWGMNFAADDRVMLHLKGRLKWADASSVIADIDLFAVHIWFGEPAKPRKDKDKPPLEEEPSDRMGFFTIYFDSRTQMRQWAAIMQELSDDASHARSPRRGGRHRLSTASSNSGSSSMTMTMIGSPVSPQSINSAFTHRSGPSLGGQNHLLTPEDAIRPHRFSDETALRRPLEHRFSEISAPSEYSQESDYSVATSAFYHPPLTPTPHQHQPPIPLPTSQQRYPSPVPPPQHRLRRRLSLGSTISAVSALPPYAPATSPENVSDGFAPDGGLRSALSAISLASDTPNPYLIPLPNSTHTSPMAVLSNNSAHTSPMVHISPMSNNNLSPAAVQVNGATQQIMDSRVFVWPPPVRRPRPLPQIPPMSALSLGSSGGAVPHVRLGEEPAVIKG